MPSQSQATLTMTDRPDHTRRNIALLGWAAGAFVLAALTVPWFLWRDSSVVAGLPMWLWWHVGWMCLASISFYAFTRYGWGIGVETTDEPDGTTEMRNG